MKDTRYRDENDINFNNLPVSVTHKQLEGLILNHKRKLLGTAD
jgi:hypothetical protein